jgi:hypothetical protein
MLSGQSPCGGVTKGLVASSVGTVWSILKNPSAPVRGKFIWSRRWLPVVVHIEAPAARAARPTHLFNLLLPCGRTATVALGPEAVGSTGAISTPTARHPRAPCNATASSIDNTPATTRSPGSTAASSAAAICGAIPATQALMAREQDHSPPAILRADPETASRASSSLLSIGASASPASSTSGAKSRSATTVTGLPAAFSALPRAIIGWTSPRDPRASSTTFTTAPQWTFPHARRDESPA